MGDAFLIWRETYAVGHLGLDREHKRLVELINGISGLDAGTSASRRLSNIFHLASVEHFRHENAVMRDLIEGAYLLPGDAVQQGLISENAVNDHRAEHARALIKLERLLQATKDLHGPILASELRFWFLDHAINHDAHLKVVFQGRTAMTGGPAMPGQMPVRFDY